MGARLLSGKEEHIDVNRNLIWGAITERKEVKQKCGEVRSLS